MALKTYRIICTPLAYIFVLSFLSCIKSDMPVLNEELSLFAFIISDNNLDSHTDYIEKDLVQGLKGCPVGTELFLYIDRRTETPVLQHLFLLESGQIGVRTISEYSELCSTSPIVFNDVMQTMERNSSGRQFGLIYWSHGNGWLPGSASQVTSNIDTRALGTDGIYSMDIDDMSNVLSGTKTPLFTVLDACFMGSVEVAYSLRKATDYLIASSGETLGAGFPYHLMLPEFAKGNRESLIRSLDIYLDYCHTDYYGDGTISGMASLVDCSQMDALASSFKIILEKNELKLNLDSIQAFDCLNPHIYYDLLEYAKSIVTRELF